MTPPKPITALYRDFEAAHSAVQEAPDAKVDVSIEKCRKIAAEIVKLPAQNIDEMILKSASHCVAPVPSEAWKPWQASTRGRPECPANTGRTTGRSNFDCLCSLRDDLFALGRWLRRGAESCAGANCD